MNTTEEIAERALNAGGGAEERLVIADETTSLHLRWANNTLTSNGSTHHRMLTVVATASGRGGTATGVVSHGGAVDAHAIETLVHAAEREAMRASPAEDAHPLLVDGESRVAAAEPAAATTVEELDPTIAELSSAFRSAHAQRRLLFGYAEQQLRRTYLTSSTGLRRHHVQPTAVVDMTAKTAEGAASSTWVGAQGTNLGELALSELDAELTRQLSRTARRIDLPAGRYEVLLPPSCVADLMLHLYQAMGAKHALDGDNVFSAGEGTTQVGKRLTEAPLTLRSDPHEPGLACAPFVINRASHGSASVFDNGLKLSPTSWITDGLLDALVQTRHSAQLTGLPVTPQIDNLVLEGTPPGRSLNELIADTERGLLLTSLWYLREVDPRSLLLTGLTRDGVYLVERGKVVGAVNNFRFNESPATILERVTEIGRTERCLPREWGDSAIRMAMPALRVDDFAMSSVSEAS